MPDSPCTINRLTVAEKIKQAKNFSCPEGKLYAEMWRCERIDCPSIRECFYYRLPDLNLHASQVDPKPESHGSHATTCRFCALYSNTSCSFYSLRDVIKPTDAACCDFHLYSRKRPFR